MSVQDAVAEFHRTFGHPIAEKPGLIPLQRAALRHGLIQEELAELSDAMVCEDIVEIADALGDLLYVVYGAALEYGIDMGPVVDEIHQSNMSKLGDDGKPIYREDGKIMKGPNYFPPDLSQVIAAQEGI